MTPLHKAYRQILRLYQKEGLIPGRLEGIGFGDRWTYVSASLGQTGMAFHFSGAHAVYGPVDPGPLTSLQRFVGGSVLSLLDFLLQENDLEQNLLFSSVAMAGLNGLSTPLNTEARLKAQGFSPLDPDDLDFVSPEDFVSVVGAGGISEQLRRRGIFVHVIDMRPAYTLENLYVGHTIQRGPAGVSFHGPEDTGALFSQSDVIFLTGSTLVNHSFFDLMPQTQNARVVGLYGPSAQLLFDFLQEYGVSYVVTNRVVEPELLRQTLLGQLGAPLSGAITERYAFSLGKNRNNREQGNEKKLE